MFKMPPEEVFLKNPKYYDHQKDLYYAGLDLCKKKDYAIDVGAHIGFFSSKMVKDFKMVGALFLFSAVILSAMVLYMK